MHILLFLLCAAFCVGGAINLLVQPKAINSALSLIVVMCSLAMLYLLLGAEFVAVVQVIVYAGAIMVLFVFVIMLLNAGKEETTSLSKVALVVGIPALLGFAALVMWLAARHGLPGRPLRMGSLYGSAEQVGSLIFGKYLLAFEATSVLVLIAILGAVILARRSES